MSLLARLRRGAPPASGPAILTPIHRHRIDLTSVRGALALRRMRAGSRRRGGAPQAQIELDTADSWLEALHDTLRLDHELARIVARSGTLVQGAGASRDAQRVTALAFWGRIVRQCVAIDRSAQADAPYASREVIPVVWRHLCASGPLALWEVAGPVLGCALAHARGASYEQTVAQLRAACAAFDADTTARSI
jgi:hypothetical protein